MALPFRSLPQSLGAQLKKCIWGMHRSCVLKACNTYYYYYYYCYYYYYYHHYHYPYYYYYYYYGLSAFSSGGV